ncbi:MAG: permease [Bacillota bacterium]
MSLFAVALSKVWHTFTINWPLLLFSAVVATAMKLYVDQKKVAAALRRNQGAGVFGATGLAVTTPLCSCGTTAVILGMMATTFPWAPIIAFMVASPLTSPQELIYSASLFGWPFALSFFVASILLGLAAGLVAHVAERRGWLVDQARYKPIAGGAPAAEGAAGTAVQARPDARRLLMEFGKVGGQLFAFFFVFAFVGYVLNGLIPAAWMTKLFGSGHIYGVPLAAILGLPLYINTEASLPLARSLMDLGMSPGAMLAFLITGAGTSIGAIAGALTIAKWRVVGIVVGTLLVGSIIIGYAYNGMHALGWL